METDLGGEAFVGRLVNTLVGEGTEKDVRDVHQQLLVGIAAEFGLRVQSLVPGLFADSTARARGALVECVDGVKVDLSVEAVL